MVRQFENVYVLDTNSTTYAFRIIDTGHLEHLYYGKRITIQRKEDADSLCEKHAFAPGNTNTYDKAHTNFT